MPRRKDDQRSPGDFQIGDVQTRDAVVASAAAALHGGEHESPTKAMRIARHAAGSAHDRQTCQNM